MNIKTKLTYGIGLLFVLITLLGGLAIKNIHNVSDDTQNILADNYNSLLYSRQMLESLDAIRENPNARKNYSLRCIINDKFNTCKCFKSSDISTLSTNNTAFHFVIRKLNY